MRPHRKRHDPGPDRTSRPDPRIVRRLIGLSRPYLGRLALAGVCLLISTVVLLTVPYMIRLLTDSVFVHHDPNELNHLALAVIGVVVIAAVFGYGRGYLLAYVGSRIVTDLRVRLYGHLLDLSLSFYDRRRAGDLMSRLSADTALMQDILSNGLLVFLQQVIMLVGVVVVVVLINWHLALAAFVLMPGISLIAIVMGRRIRALAERSQAQLGEASVVVEETLSAMRIVKAFGREPYEFRRYESAVQSSFRLGLATARLRSGFGSLMIASSFIALGTVLWLGGHEVLAGRLTAGGLISFLLYMTFLVGPLESLSGLYSQFQQAAGGAARVFEVLDIAPSIVDRADAVDLPPASGLVEFCDVTFTYGPDYSNVLTDVSITARPGQRLALVGPSGAGKTTLVSLLPRFYEPAHGVIQIDGRDISSVTIKSLRRTIAIVPQDPTLFGGTVRENIAYGRTSATMSEIEAAALASNAHAFVTALPEGYDTLVGDRGVRLSGGQRQRIAIARALLRDPRILILDEATSALDNESEALVQEALERLMVGRTSLVIAHRLTTVENADWIVVLDEGRVVEEGTHAGLMTREGLYSRLYLRSFDTEVDIPA
jgi:ATP-binding cassette, subfamily B, bacterial MsbA